jgi:hypothetical protein
MRSTRTSASLPNRLDSHPTYSNRRGVRVADAKIAEWKKSIFQSVRAQRAHSLGAAPGSCARGPSGAADHPSSTPTGCHYQLLNVAGNCAAPRPSCPSSPHWSRSPPTVSGVRADGLGRAEPRVPETPGKPLPCVRYDSNLSAVGAADNPVAVIGRLRSNQECSLQWRVLPQRTTPSWVRASAHRKSFPLRAPQLQLV